MAKRKVLGRTTDAVSVTIGSVADAINYINDETFKEDMNTIKQGLKQGFRQAIHQIAEDIRGK